MNSSNAAPVAHEREEIQRHYREHGWVVVPDVFRAEEADDVAALALGIGYRELETDPNPHLTVTIDADHGRLAPRKVDWAFLKADAFRDFVLDERLSDLVALLLGRRGYLARDHVFLKPPQFGSAKPLHQDHTHFLCEPIAHCITAWVALDDVDESNGCLRYVDGSHRLPPLEHAPLKGREHNWAPVAGSLAPLSPDSATPISMTRGSVAFHHPLTLHGSKRNSSARWRRAYSSQWVAADVTCRGDLVEWAYSETVGAGRHRVRCP